MFKNQLKQKLAKYNIHKASVVYYITNEKAQLQTNEDIDVLYAKSKRDGLYIQIRE